MPENIKAVIFDIDGTLFDSLDAWSESDKILLEENGIEYDPSISYKLKTMHYTLAAKYLVEKCGLKITPEEANDRILEIIRYKYFHEIPLKPFAREFIEKCRGDGLKLCAATSNIKTLAEGAMKNRGILDHFSFILTSDEMGSGKDNPEIFLKCAEMLDVSPENTAVFEDSPHAARSAAEAGFVTFGVYDEHYKEELPILEKICSRVIFSFEELL